MMKFHDVLHVFCTCSGTGVAIIELNMDQELVNNNQDPLLLVFLDLCKDYNMLDRGRLLQTLKGYRAGPKMQGILADFWENQEMVTK